MDNKDLTIVRPYTEDPLYSTLLSLNADDMKLLSKSNKDDKMNFKLKSRLLIEEENSIVSRC